MDLAWTNSLDQLWRSPSVPMWLTLAAAAFFALIFFIIVLRAERSVANGALTVMTLVAVAVAAAATMRGPGPGEEAAFARGSGVTAALPALACIDDLAGDSVESACERILFGSPDHVAAAVSYAAARLGRLTALGDAAAANKVMTPDLRALRRAVERDRYGFVAHVLVARDGCTAAVCAAYQSLTDHRPIAANIEGRLYEARVARYAPSWSGTANVGDAGSAASADAGPASVSGEPAAAPTGKPTNAEFPSAASIPPVSIMTPEPPTSSTPPATPPAAASTTPRPAAAPKTTAPKAAAPKTAAPKAADGHAAAAAKRRTNAAPPPAPPVQIVPPPSAASR